MLLQRACRGRVRWRPTPCRSPFHAEDVASTGRGGTLHAWARARAPWAAWAHARAARTARAHRWLAGTHAPRNGRPTLTRTPGCGAGFRGAGAGTDLHSSVSDERRCCCLHLGGGILGLDWWSWCCSLQSSLCHARRERLLPVDFVGHRWRRFLLKYPRWVVLPGARTLMVWASSRAGNRHANVCLRLGHQPRSLSRLCPSGSRRVTPRSPVSSNQWSSWRLHALLEDGRRRSKHDGACLHDARPRMHGCHALGH